MYFGEDVNRIEAPKTDVDWDKLFSQLCAPVSETPTDAIIKYHAESTKEWSKVRSEKDKETVAEMLEFTKRCIKKGFDGIIDSLPDTTDFSKVPDISGIIADPHAMRVIETDQGKKYSILIQIRDYDGRSMAVFTNGVSIPTQSAVMIELNADPEMNEVGIFIRSSEQAYWEDVDNAQRVVKLQGAKALYSGFKPILFKMVQQVLASKFGDETKSPTFVRNIDVTIDSRDNPAVIVHLDTVKGRFRLLTHYNERTCGPTALFCREPEDESWNTNHMGE